MRLDEYTVRFQRYPWLKPFSPFSGWQDHRASQSLEWYQAYNSLKHAKRKNEDKASMKNAIFSAAAYYTLAFAVFGPSLFPGFFSDHFYFLFESYPIWGVTEHYFKSDDEKWSPMFLAL